MINYSLERFEAETDIEHYVEHYVDIEAFLKCCKTCPSFGAVWSCPPFDFHPMSIWQAHERIRIVGYRLTFDEDRTEEGMNEALREVKQKLSEELYEMEQEIPGSLSLSAGTCQVCDRCTKPEGKPCRFPEKMRHSIESLGGNVGKTISELCGIEIEWIEEGKLPEHYVLVSALLI